MRNSRKVAIIYRYIPQYRKQFYLGLRDKLAKYNIELVLIYGQASENDKLKNDEVHFDWAINQPSLIIPILGHELYWQPVLKYLKNVDLVIVEQASKLLINYVLLLQNALGIRKLAFWGHGKNFQATSANRLAEWIKRKISTRVHWWFAYNDLSVRVVENLGFPSERITNVQNSINTEALIKSYHKIELSQLEEIKRKIGIKSNNVCLFIGGMYSEKRIPFLLEAIKIIRNKIPDFEMVFIGDGVDADLVRTEANKTSWIHYIGSCFGEEKIPYFAISKLLLMPGRVGLAILDSFALETPLITTNTIFHAPEIDYLIQGINGVMVEDDQDVNQYANTVIALLNNEQKLLNLITGCRISRRKYSIENMVDNFCHGIMKALEI